MLHITWLVFCLIVGLACVVGAAIWDFIWTAWVPDHIAEIHFGVVSTRRRLVWLLIGLLVIVAVIGWIR